MNDSNFYKYLSVPLSRHEIDMIDYQEQLLQQEFGSVDWIDPVEAVGEKSTRFLKFSKRISEVFESFMIRAKRFYAGAYRAPNEIIAE